MHVNILEVQNYMKVDAFRIDAHGNHVIISAANDSGKSSVVNGLYDGIQGVNLKLHPDPVRHGADKAVIKIDTDESFVQGVPPCPNVTQWCTRLRNCGGKS